MKPDIVKFVESTLCLKLTEFQKKFLRTYYENKDIATETLYLNIGRSNKKVIVKELQFFLKVLELGFVKEKEDERSKI